MSPIRGVSEIRRMPRLGKVRLGIKEISSRTQNPYPKATDYFVVPDEVKQFLEDNPKKLKIMFPVEKVEEFAQQWLRCYSFTQGLICKGDGTAATRKVDVATGAIADYTTKEWVFKQCPCDPDTCPEYMGDPAQGIKPQCRRVMNLLFLMPDIPGFGVWQLDTSSFYSIVNINSCIDLIKRICGRISFVPLTLSLEAMEVTPPGVKRKTVHILAIRSDIKLMEIQKLGRILPERILLPVVEEEEAPGDLFPPEVVVQAEVAKHKVEESWPPSELVETKTPEEACRLLTVDSIKEELIDEGWTMEKEQLVIKGDDFTIDLTWWNEVKKRLKWTTDTALSFILSQFQVTGKDDIEALGKLTREQAERFTEVINRKLENQPNLF